MNNKDLYVEFEQDNYFFRKNADGRKSNIVVEKKKSDQRFNVLFCVMKELNKKPLKLIVKNSGSAERLIVDVSDVTYFKGFYIISWRSD